MITKHYPYFIAFVLLLLCGQEALAQTTVHGTVADEKEKPMEFVNVVAMQLPDSTFIKGSVTDAKGAFKMEGLPKKSYLVVSSIGYKTQMLETRAQMRIVLKEDEVALKDVVVTAQRIKHRATGYEYSLKNSPLAKGRNPMQLLEQLPNISIKNDKIELLGRAVQIIYVDDVKITLSELKAIPTKDIESIEVDYSSSIEEGVNAAGGILRIRLRPERSGGYSGMLMGDIGYMPHYRTDAIPGSATSFISVRWGKWSLRNTLWLSYFRTKSEEELTLLNLNSKQRTESKTESVFKMPDISNRLTLGYDFTPKHAVLLSGYVDFDKSSRISTTTTAALQAITEIKSSTPQVQLLGNYTWKIDEMKKLVLPADYFGYTSYEATMQDNNTSFSRSKSNFLRVKPTYQQSFSDGGQLLLGADMRWIGQGEETSQDLNPTALKASTPALFASYDGKLGNFMYSAGLRLQYDDMKVTRAEESNSYKYFGLYPSISSMYFIDKEKGHFLRLMAEREVSDLPYSAISAYRQYYGSKSYMVGNPALRPPISSTAMLTIGLWGKLNLNAMLIHEKYPIHYETRIDETDPSVTYTKPYNGDYMMENAFSAEWNWKPTKWWKTKTSANFNLLNADIGTIKARNQTYWNFRHSSTFSFSQSAGAGIIAWYETGRSMLDRKWEWVAHLEGYAYMTFFNDDLQVQLEFIPYRHERVAHTFNEQLHIRQANTTRSPRITLTLTYYFRGGKKVEEAPEAEKLQSYHSITDMR